MGGNQAETAAQKSPDQSVDLTDQADSSPPLEELTEAFQAGVDGKPYNPESLQDFQITDPQVAELLNAFKAGVDGKRYVPRGQELAWNIDNLETQRYNDGDTKNRY